MISSEYRAVWGGATPKWDGERSRSDHCVTSTEPMSGPIYDTKGHMCGWASWSGRARPHNGRLPGHAWRARCFAVDALPADRQNQEWMLRLMRADQASGHPDQMTAREQMVLTCLVRTVHASSLLRDVRITMGQLQLLLGASMVPMCDENDVELHDDDGRRRFVLGTRHGEGYSSLYRALSALKSKGWIDVASVSIEPPDEVWRGPGPSINTYRFCVPTRLQEEWEVLRAQTNRAKVRTKDGPTPKAPQNRPSPRSLGVLARPSNDAVWTALRRTSPCEACDGDGAICVAGDLVACSMCNGLGVATVRAGP